MIRDDCRAFVYPNGFKFALEDTGAIADACRDFHGGQGCSLYRLQSSWEATPELVCEAAGDLDGAVEAWEDGLRSITPDWAEGLDRMDQEIASAWQAVEDLERWASGVRDLLED
jgi:hypothetical protein